MKVQVQVQAQAEARQAGTYLPTLPSDEMGRRWRREGARHTGVALSLSFCPSVLLSFYPLSAGMSFATSGQDCEVDVPFGVILQA